MNQSVERDSTHGPQVFGHPRGLMTLFVTEMCERFTYYGMRAILILFMTAAIADGGIGLDDNTASAIYGLYISGTYLLSLLGGWIADRLIGQQRAVIWGGVLIMLGNALSRHRQSALFFVGLMVIVLGVGLLKPNISAIVAQLYPEGGARRDAGFSIFYMGINLGARCRLSCWCRSWRSAFGWNAGFALPAIGMALGLVQFQCTRKPHLGTVAARADGRAGELDAVMRVHGGAGRGDLALGAARSAFRSIRSRSPKHSTGRLVPWPPAYFAYLLFFAGLQTRRAQAHRAMIALFVACAMFWAGFEQAGASFNLFAERYTDRNDFRLGNCPPARCRR